MKRRLLLSVLSRTFLAGSNTLDIEKGTPGCVKRQIKNFNKGNVCNDAKVDEYKFQGKTVYLFDRGTCGCDFGHKVIDEDCNELGMLGTIIGVTKINGEGFYSNATFVQTVWKK